MSMITRAAFDIGSGMTKLQVARVCRQSNRIKEVLFHEERPVKFALDLKANADGKLSEEVQADGLRVLGDQMAIARSHNTQQYAAIATEVFRLAKNGSDFLKRVLAAHDLQVHIITQQEEAELGYATASGLCDFLPPSRLISWDSGGGSFQIATRMNGSFETYMGKLGASIGTAMCVTEVQQRTFNSDTSPNPVSMAEVEKLQEVYRRRLTPPPAWLTDTKTAVAVGGPNSIFNLASYLLQGAREYTPRDVLKLIQHFVDKGDDYIIATCCQKNGSDPPSMVVPKLTLLYTVARHCGIETIHFIPACGSCAGVLVTEAMYADAAAQAKL